MHNFSPLFITATYSIVLSVVHCSGLLMWTFAAVGVCTISGNSEDIDSEIFGVILQHLS